LFQKTDYFKVNREPVGLKAIMPALDIGSLASNVELALFPVASKWLTSLSDYKPFGNLSSNYPFVPLPLRKCIQEKTKNDTVSE